MRRWKTTTSDQFMNTPLCKDGFLRPYQLTLVVDVTARSPEKVCLKFQESLSALCCSTSLVGDSKDLNFTLAVEQKNEAVVHGRRDFYVLFKGYFFCHRKTVTFMVVFTSQEFSYADIVYFSGI